MVISCTNSSSNDEGDGGEPPIATPLWELVQFENTSIFASYSTDNNLYSFTGFEVFKSNNDGTNPVQINELNDRSIFFVEGSSNTLFSISDSTILISTDETTSFDTLKISGITIRSALIDQNDLYITTEAGAIFSVDLASEERDTLYQSNSSESLRLISLLDDDLYINVNNSVKLFVLSDLESGFQSPGFESSSTNEFIQLEESNILLAATRFQKIQRSTDGGKTWTGSGPDGIPANPITDLYLTEEGRVYVSILGSGVFYSDDQSESWKSVTDTVLNTSVYSFTETVENDLLANTDSGIYKALFDPKTN